MTVDPGEFLDRLDPRELELHQLRRQLAEAKHQRQLAYAELLKEQQRTDLVLALAAHRELPPIVPRVSKRREATAVVLASDWHVEERVDPATVNGMNAYDPAIAEKRAGRFWDAAVQLVKHHRSGSLGIEIQDVLVWLGGDLINGYIHEEMLAANDMSPAEAVLFAERLIVPGLRFLLSELNPVSLIVPCDPGNHGRTGRTKSYSNPRNNYEWLLYHAIAKQFAGDERVRFSIADGSMQYVQVYDQTIRFHHGDDVRFGGGVGGLSIPLVKAVARWDQGRQADLTCIGHFHTLSDFGRVVVNGSLVGLNGYALSTVKAAPEPPAQAFFLLDKHRGKCQSTAIWV